LTALVLIGAAMILSRGRPGSEKGTATPKTIEVPPSHLPLSVMPAPVGSVVSPSAASAPRVELATKEAVTRAATLVQTGDRATMLAVLGAAMAVGWLLVKAANPSAVSNH
jgi:hypothetical protein